MEKSDSYVVVDFETVYLLLPNCSKPWKKVSVKLCIC